jgi:hypothetical protein
MFVGNFERLVAVSARQGRPFGVFSVELCVVVRKKARRAAALGGVYVARSVGHQAGVKL